MSMFHVRSLSRPRLLMAGACATVLATAACSGSSAPATTDNPSSSQAPAPSASAPSTDPALAAAYKGTLSEPDSSSRPAVKGKKIVIISSGQASESSAIPVNAAKEAAEKLGWKVTVYDDQLNPANDGNLFNQAIASGADGIILDAIDC